MTEPFWADETCTLYLGDCREVTEWLDADVLVTDPPYGIDYRTSTGGQFTSRHVLDGDATTTVRDEALSLWGDRPAVVFGSYKQHAWGQPNMLPLIFDKGDIVGMGDWSWPWRPNYEIAWVYGKGWTGKRSGAVLRHRVLPGNFTDRDHPTQKPVELFAEIIAKAPPGVIADPFAGSGSTLVAAKRLGRKSIGVEVDERYCEIAARRLAQGILDFGEVGA